MRSGSAAVLSLRVFTLVVALAACGHPTADAPPAGAAPEAPSLVGVVTAVRLPVIMVEEKPAETSGSPKASVRITERTLISRSGKSLAPDGLKVGQRVSVWFHGPVMESYPMQATAGAIVVEEVP